MSNSDIFIKKGATSKDNSIGSSEKKAKDN